MYTNSTMLLIWYSDVLMCILLTVITIILTLITFKNVYKSHSECSTSSKLPAKPIFYVSLCIVFISFNMVSMSALCEQSLLLILPDTNQPLICDIVHILCFIVWGINNLSIDVLQISRLRAVFMKIPRLRLSKYTYYYFLFSFTFVWIIIVAAGPFLIVLHHQHGEHISIPYNVYTETIDLDGNGVICVLRDVFDYLMIQLVFMIAIVLGHLSIWFLFVRKLYALISDINTASKGCELDQFQMECIKLMKEQTMLVAIIVASILFSWVLTWIFHGYVGHFFIMLSIITTLIGIFVSFSFNRYYFELLRCDKCTVYFCKWFEIRILGKISVHRAEINIVETHKTEPTSNTVDHQVETV
eukprot:54079_1